MALTRFTMRSLKGQSGGPPIDTGDFARGRDRWAEEKASSGYKTTASVNCSPRRERTPSRIHVQEPFRHPRPVRHGVQHRDRQARSTNPAAHLPRGGRLRHRGNARPRGAHEDWRIQSSGPSRGQNQPASSMARLLKFLDGGPTGTRTVASIRKLASMSKEFVRQQIVTARCVDPSHLLVNPVRRIVINEKPSQVFEHCVWSPGVSSSGRDGDRISRTIPLPR